MTPGSADAAAIDTLFGEFVASGRLPPSFPLVQGRLVRAVHRGELPSGPVFVKAMAFPRAKDRLRYALRALPAVHEASMLAAVAAAGVACPEVLAVRVRRCFGLPFRSLLVLRTLPMAPPGPPEDPWLRLAEEAAIAVGLLGAGILHRDLHSGNFVRLRDGRLAVLDLQSASRSSPVRTVQPAARVAIAARLLRDRADFDLDRAVDVLQRAGLLRSGDERAGLARQLLRHRRHYARTRLLRCCRESTGFTVTWRWHGREFRRRGDLPAGRWWSGGRALRDAWLGQRALHLQHGRPPLFPAFFQKWWWLGGGGALYVPAACTDERIEQEVAAAVAGRARPEVGDERR